MELLGPAAEFHNLTNEPTYRDCQCAIVALDRGSERGAHQSLRLGVRRGRSWGGGGMKPGKMLKIVEVRLISGTQKLVVVVGFREDR